MEVLPGLEGLVATTNRERTAIPLLPTHAPHVTDHVPFPLPLWLFTGEAHGIGDTVTENPRPSPPSPSALCRLAHWPIHTLLLRLPSQEKLMEVLPGLEGLVATANRERNTDSPDPADFAGMVTDQLMERFEVISRHFEEEAQNVKELHRYDCGGGGGGCLRPQPRVHTGMGRGQARVSMTAMT